MNNMKKIIASLALCLMGIGLFAQTSLKEAVAPGNKVYVEIVNDAEHPMPDKEIGDLIRESAAAGQWEAVSDKQDASFVLSIVTKKKMVFNSPRTWLTPSVLDLDGNVLWKGDTYKADATMFNGYRATNAAIAAMIKKGFVGNLFKKAER